MGVVLVVAGAQHKVGALIRVGGCETYPNSLTLSLRPASSKLYVSEVRRLSSAQCCSGWNAEGACQAVTSRAVSIQSNWPPVPNGWKEMGVQRSADKRRWYGRSRTSKGPAGFRFGRPAVAQPISPSLGCSLARVKLAIGESLLRVQSKLSMCIAIRWQWCRG